MADRVFLVMTAATAAAVKSVIDDRLHTLENGILAAGSFSGDAADEWERLTTVAGQLKEPA